MKCDFVVSTPCPFFNLSSYLWEFPLVVFERNRKRMQIVQTRMEFGLRKDVLWPPINCKDTQHPTWRVKKERSIRYWLGGRWLGGRGLHTTRSIAQIFLGVVLISLLTFMIVVKQSWLHVDSIFIWVPWHGGSVTPRPVLAKRSKQSWLPCRRATSFD
jgi:hypothetical protein